MIPGSATPLLLAGAAEAADYQIERSIRLNSSDSAYLSRTPASAGNRNTWTLSWWMKRSKLSNDYQTIFGVCDASATYYTQLRFSSNDKLSYQEKGSANGTVFETEMVFRDVASWYHCVFVFNNTASSNSEKARLYVNGSEVTSFSTDNRSQIGTTSTAWNNNVQHNISHMRPYSGPFDFDGYLAEIHFIDGVSGLTASDFGKYDNNNLWQPKEYSGTYGTNGFYLNFSDNSSASALGTDSSGNNNTWTVNNITAISAFSTPVSAAWTGYLGSNWLTTDTWDSLSDATTNFGNNGGTKGYSTVTETWAGTKTSWTGAFGASNRGANGWALKFPASVTITVNPVATSSITACASTSTAVSAGTSYTSFPATMTGQVFWFACSGFPSVGVYNSVAIPAPDYTDSLIDTPTNYEADSGNNGGNYATLNSLNNGGLTLANGNLDYSHTTSAWDTCTGTIGASSGKYYWEITVATWNGSGAPFLFGIANTSQDINAELGQSANSWCYLPTGQKRHNGSTASYGASLATGDVVGIALDMDNGTLTFYKNGSSQGQAYSSITGFILPAVSVFGNTSQSGAYNFNAGQRPFAYTPPTGFKSLCSTNLPDPTIADGSTAMDVVLDTGANILAAAQAANNSGADLLWIKDRANANNHQLIDTVRGSTAVLQSNTNSSEEFVSTYSAPSGSSVAWIWDAGSSTVTNTDGSINSTVRANPATGFSIISAAEAAAVDGSTLGHGLNAKPEMIIEKARDSFGAWYVHHSGMGNMSGTYMRLNENYSAATDPNWNISEPTNSVISIDPGYLLASVSANVIYYCFAPVDGFSAFGSYTGNGDYGDGPFVNLGFRPKWVLLKRTDNPGDWFVLDSERNLFNPTDSYLRPNLANSELDNTELIDLLSNGFKIRADGNDYNGNSATIIYAAFAEHPFASNARAR